MADPRKRNVVKKRVAEMHRKHEHHGDDDGDPQPTDPQPTDPTKPCDCKQDNFDDGEGFSDFVEGCRIRLPKNDVVEAIEFEKFYLLNLKYSDGRAPTSSEPTAASGSDESVAPKVPAPDELRLAFHLPFRQEWRMLGYSRGRMVNSLTLGPLEEQTIEIFKWDRATRNMESTTSFDLEETQETTGTRRDTSDVAKDISRQSGFETNTEAKVGIKAEVVNADFSGGLSAKTALNEAEKSTRQAIVEATSRATTHVRSSRTLKVVETRESGQETRVTRKLRNNNTCHSLTTAFFEILANYKAATFLRAEGVRIVALIEASSLADIQSFTRDRLRSHERALRFALLDQSLAPGFDAARFLDARERACGILCTGCRCSASAAGAGGGAEWEALKAALIALGGIVTTLRSYAPLPFPTYIFFAEAENVAKPPVKPGTDDINRRAFTIAMSKYAPTLLSRLAGINLSMPATPDAEAVGGILGALAPEAIPAMTYDKGTSESLGVSLYGEIFTINPEPISCGIRTGALIGGIGGLSSYNNAGLPGALTDVKAKYDAWKAFLEAQKAKDAKREEMERIAAEERALRVLEAYPLRETADAMERLEALLAHLNDPRNRDHYRFAVWNERAGSDDPVLLGLALAQISDGPPVGAVGSQLAVPVKVPPGSKLEQLLNDSLADIRAAQPRDEHDYILPTSAIYAEAFRGRCVACEDNVVRSEELDLRRRELENLRAEIDVKRVKARLDSGKLDSENCDCNGNAIRLEVTNKNR
jgi:hypothetical protein